MGLGLAGVELTGLRSLGQALHILLQQNLLTRRPA